MSYTCVLSGPDGERTHVLTALDRAGVQVPIEAQRAVNPSHHLPLEDGVEWITCHAEHPNELDSTLARFKWRLRMHYPTPARAARPSRDLLAEIDGLTRRLAALEGTR